MSESLPEGWTVGRVDEFGEVQCGRQRVPDGPGTPRPYLRVANVFDGSIDTRDVNTMPFTDAEFQRYLLRDEDVLLNEGQSLDLVGRAAMYRGELAPCAFQNSLIRFRAGSSAHSGFFEQLFRHFQARGTFAEIATKTTSIAHLGVGRLASLKARVPPLAEQRKIAAILSSIDDAIARTQAVIDQLQVVKTAMLEELLTRGIPGRHTRFKMTEIGEVPEGWRVAKISDVGSVQAGRQRSVNAPGTPRPYLRVANVFDGKIDRRDLNTMPFTEEEFLRFQLREGDVLLNEGQSLDLVGRAAMYRGDPPGCAFQNSLIRFRCGASIRASFAEQSFRFFQKTGRFSEIATKTTSIAHLGVLRFASMLMGVPSLKEQDEISRALRSIDQMLSTNACTLDGMKFIKSALASVLLTGELRVRVDGASP